MISSTSFTIDTEVSPSYFEDLLKFFEQQYICPHQERFANVRREVDGNDKVLYFTVLGPEGKWYIDVEMRTGKPINVRMAPSVENLPPDVLRLLREDLIIGVQLFEEKIRRTTLYFAWVEGEEVIPEKAPLRSRKIIHKIFSESMLPLFITFIAASILLFMVLGPYAPISLVALQFLMILFSDRIIARTGDWKIKEKNPYVHLVAYPLPIEDYRGFVQRYGTEMLTKIKAEIYEKTFSAGKRLDCETVQEVLSKYGFKCVPEDMFMKVIDVYGIVKKAAEKFGLPIPKIVVVNTILPNAAASGPSPGRGVILITTGLLVQLEEDEILSVVGHEFSHLRARDPIILFILTSAEYLLRVYFLWPLLFLFGYFYFFFAMGLVYFIAKFLESRADLESAVQIGQPKVLAEALQKIGYRRLQFERMPSYKIQEWIGLDPHPPIYFRVARLEKLEPPVKIKYPLLQSIKDNIYGFYAALR
ncbi:MAG: M48 family metallopeptidase [Thermoproteota archaeon]